MPWCPKCNAEYVEGLTRCYDCDVELVDEPVEQDEVSKKASKDQITDHVKEVLLVIVDDLAAFGYITSLLENEGIAHWVTEQGADHYFSKAGGMKFYAKSIYVSEYDLDKAKEIVDSYVPDEDIDNEALKDECYVAEDTAEPYGLLAWIYGLESHWMLLLIVACGIVFWFIAYIMIYII